jgi:hypothetical protein
MARISALTYSAIGVKPAAFAVKKRRMHISLANSLSRRLPDCCLDSGKADFDGQLIDVIAEGMPIDRGRAIVVVKARGNRVLVRAVEA